MKCTNMTYTQSKDKFYKHDAYSKAIINSTNMTHTKGKNAFYKHDICTK